VFGLENLKLGINDFYLTTQEPKEMANNGMIIGSHSVNHKVLSKLSYEEQDYEITNSFDFI